MTIENLICGIAGSIIATLLIWLATKMYFGASSFRGLKNTIRLIKDCSTAGIINIFPNRQSYIHHKDHGSQTQYISRCNNKLMYVGYWLAQGTEVGDIINALQRLIFDKKNVELVLMNPYNDVLLNDIADFLHTDYIEIQQRIKNSLEKLCKMKRSLPDEFKTYITIKMHDIPLNASAFLIDYDNEKDLRILVDYKIYNRERERSYGIEFITGNLSCTLCDSYKEISKNAKPCKE